MYVAVLGCLSSVVRDRFFRFFFSPYHVSMTFGRWKIAGSIPTETLFFFFFAGGAREWRLVIINMIVVHVVIQRLVL